MPSTERRIARPFSVRLVCRSEECRALFERYPGVDFFGTLTASTYIDGSAKIAPGAWLDLTLGVSLDDTTEVGPHAKLSGPTTIEKSTIQGRVESSYITRSTLAQDAAVYLSTVSETAIHGGSLVTCSSLKKCFLNERVQVNLCRLEQCFVDAGRATARAAAFMCYTLSPGHAYEHVNRDTSSTWPQVPRPTSASHQPTVSSEPQNRTPFTDTHTPEAPSSSWPQARQEAYRATQKKIASNDAEKFDCDPPELFIDRAISYGMIHDAVFTPNGDIYDRAVIEHEIARNERDPKTRRRLRKEDLRPLRGLTDMIDEWKLEHRIEGSHPLEEAGRSERAEHSDSGIDGTW